MANNDSSFNNLRFDAISQTVQYAEGNNWVNVPSSGSGALVVASVSLTAQGADISLTTLFTPDSTGIYQFSAYAVTTTEDAGAGSPALNISYTDDSGVQTTTTDTSMSLAILGQPGSSVNSYECVSGQPVTYSFTGGTPYGAAQYSLYIAVVKL